MIQIHSVHRLNPDANELLGQRSNLWVLTDNLPVEIGTSRSAFASEHDEHRFSGFGTQSFTVFVIENPFDVAVDIGRGWFRLRIGSLGWAEQYAQTGNRPQDGAFNFHQLAFELQDRETGERERNTSQLSVRI